MIIKILGSGCRRCIALADNAIAAARAAGKEAQIVKITDMAEIAAYGVMSTPGLVIDERRGVFNPGRPEPGKLRTACWPRWL